MDEGPFGSGHVDRHAHHAVCRHHVVLSELFSHLDRGGTPSAQHLQHHDCDRTDQLDGRDEVCSGRVSISQGSGFRDRCPCPRGRRLADHLPSHGAQCHCPCARFGNQWYCECDSDRVGFELSWIGGSASACHLGKHSFRWEKLHLRCTLADLCPGDCHPDCGPLFQPFR